MLPIHGCIGNCLKNMTLEGLGIFSISTLMKIHSIGFIWQAPKTTNAFILRLGMHV